MASKRQRAVRRSSRPTQSRNIWRRGRWWFIGGGAAAAITLVAALALVFAGSEAPERAAAGETQLVSFEAAPDVTLATASGKFRLSESRGEVLLLYFSFHG